MESCIVDQPAKDGESRELSKSDHSAPSPRAKPSLGALSQLQFLLSTLPHAAPPDTPSSVSDSLPMYSLEQQEVYRPGWNQEADLKPSRLVGARPPSRSRCFYIFLL